MYAVCTLHQGDTEPTRKPCASLGLTLSTVNYYATNLTAGWRIWIDPAPQITPRLLRQIADLLEASEHDWSAVDSAAEAYAARMFGALTTPAHVAPPAPALEGAHP
jgi:hypothetical protein